jgi:hypothetical protein
MFELQLRRRIDAAAGRGSRKAEPGIVARYCGLMSCRDPE